MCFKLKFHFVNSVIICCLLCYQIAFGEEEECFSGGNIAILAITPSSSIILEGFKIYTFAVTVEYNFTNLESGVIGSRAFDSSSWENLDDQVQNDLNVSSQNGVETIYVTARVAQNDNMIDNAGISVFLIDEVFEGACTSVFDNVFYAVDNTNVPEKGDINNDKQIDLKDLVLCLKILSGESNIILDDRADIDRNYRLGIENAIYLLNYLKD